MSLAQHVTATEGFDREAPLSESWTPSHHSAHHSINSDHPPWHHKSVRRVLSYDAFPPLEREVTLKEEYGGITPYHVPVAKRIGSSFPLLLIVFSYATSPHDRYKHANLKTPSDKHINNADSAVLQLK